MGDDDADERLVNEIQGLLSEMFDDGHITGFSMVVERSRIGADDSVESIPSLLVHDMTPWAAAGLLRKGAQWADEMIDDDG